MGVRADYHLGLISERYESSGPGTISTGKGDHGGVSYGTYQLSTAEGTIDEYLKQSVYREQFKDLTPNTKAFNDMWRELAGKESNFAQDQRDFIKSTHYDPQVSRLKANGLDLSERGEAVQEALWSTSVQYHGLTKKIFEGGLKERFGNSYKLSELTDKDIVAAVQDYKIAHNKQLFQSSPGWWGRLHDRAMSEKEDLLALADGKPLPERTHSRDTRYVALKQGMHGDDVKHTQRELSELGYLQSAPDGQYGPATQAAVRQFQGDFGLMVDGKAGPVTQRQLDGAVHNSREHTARLSEACITFANPSHPHHTLYAQLKELLPPGTTDARLEQSTAACYMGGIKRPEQLDQIRIYDHAVMFTTDRPDAWASIDLTQPAPSMQQTMQQVQVYEQQQTQMWTQFRQQQQQINAQAQQGPVMGGPPMR